MRGGGWQYEQREDQQRAGDLADLGRREPEQQQERRTQGAGGYAVGTGDVGVDGREQQRSPDHGQPGQRHGRDDGEDGHLPGRDAEEAAEQQRVGAVQETLVQRDEQHAAGEGERLHGSDDGGFLGVAAAGALRKRGDDHGGEQAEREVAERQAETQPDGGGRAGEPDEGERVPGEALPAQHHEPADKAGQDRDDRAGPERIHHARVRPHVGDVGEQVPGEDAGHARAPTCRWPGRGPA